jgi:glutathione S-transferase
MGSGASTGVAAAVAAASDEDLKKAVAGLGKEEQIKLLGVLKNGDTNGTTNGKAPSVKVYGMPPSQTSMTCILLAMDAGVGGIEFLDLMSGKHMEPEFLALNPFHHVPTVQDGAFAIGESVAILHYLALKYKPEYYPVSDPVACGYIDFAMEAFQGEVYKVGHYKTVYPTMGFAAAPEDQEAANKQLTEILDAWSGLFLKGKFVCGDKLSIADFYCVPFLFAQMQPGVLKKVGFKPNDRLMQYVDDFCAAVPATEMLKAAGGYSVKEYIANQVPDAGPPPEYKKVECSTAPTPKPAGSGVKIHAMPPSQNAVTCILMAMEVGVGGMEMCDLMNGAHMTPEFLAMNPFHHIPTMEDGEVKLGESAAILRYLALKYKPELYPVSDPALAGKVDFALEAFDFEVYSKHVKIVYPCMGFAAFPEDQEAANKAYTEALDTWTKLFLTGKFVAGDKLSIADFKAVPFLFAAAQPGVKSKTGLTLSDRVTKYIEDFCAAVASSAFMKEAGGYAIAEYIATKTA